MKKNIQSQVISNILSQMKKIEEYTLRIEEVSIFTIKKFEEPIFTNEEFSILTSEIEITFTIEHSSGIYFHNWGSIYIHNWVILNNLYSQLKENPYP